MKAKIQDLVTNEGTLVQGRVPGGTSLGGRAWWPPGEPESIWYNENIIFDDDYPLKERHRIAAHEAYHVAFHEWDDEMADKAALFCFKYTDDNPF